MGYQSLYTPTDPRSAALGGLAISLADGDISQSFRNPAILDSVNAGDTFFHINPFFADATFYSAGYSFDINGMKSFSVGLQYLNFGSFDLTDETGQELGTFTASDYVLFLSKAHQLGPFTLGASIKYLNSTIDSYSSSALALDIGGTFRVNPQWSVALTVENMGVQLSDYTTFSSNSLPFDVRLGTSFKPLYMPFRFTLTSSNLTDENFITSETDNGRSNDAINKVLRRINFGAELLLSQNFQLLAGYNHKRKQELRLEEVGGGAGFSYGVMVRVKRFQFRFSRATYHAAGGTSFISLQTNLKDFKRIL